MQSAPPLPVWESARYGGWQRLRLGPYHLHASASGWDVVADAAIIAQGRATDLCDAKHAALAATARALSAIATDTRSLMLGAQLEQQGLVQCAHCGMYGCLGHHTGAP